MEERLLHVVGVIPPRRSVIVDESFEFATSERLQYVGRIERSIVEGVILAMFMSAVGHSVEFALVGTVG